jgi:hypothetical protein
VTIRPDLAGLALAGLAAVLITVCAVVGVDVPSFLAELGLVALGVGGGALLPRAGAPAPASGHETATATPAPFAGPDLTRPAPLRAADTGVFHRIAGDH